MPNAHAQPVPPSFLWQHVIGEKDIARRHHGTWVAEDPVHHRHRAKHERAQHRFVRGKNLEFGSCPSVPFRPNTAVAASRPFVDTLWDPTVCDPYNNNGEDRLAQEINAAGKTPAVSPS